MTIALELLTTLHALAVLAVVEVSIRSVRLDRLARLLGIRLSFDPVPAPGELVPAPTLSARARRQVRCARRVADAWPLSKGPCLRRALAIGHLLRRLDPAVRLGVSANGPDVHAHAWVEILGHPLEDVGGFDVFQHTLAGGER